MCVIVLSKIKGSLTLRGRQGEGWRENRSRSGTNMTDFRVSNTCFDASKAIKLSILITPFNAYLKLKNGSIHDTSKKHKSIFFLMYLNNNTVWNFSFHYLLPWNFLSIFSKDQQFFLKKVRYSASGVHIKRLKEVIMLFFGS